MKVAGSFFYIFCLGVLLSFQSLAQVQSVADSLVKELTRMKNNHPDRLSVLNSIAQNQNDPKARLKYASMLMDEARDVQNIKYLHHAYMNQGQAYRLLGDFDVAIYALFKARDYAERCSYQRGIAASNTALADVYSLVGNHSSSILYYRESISKIGNTDSTLLATILLNMGDEFYLSKMYDSALVRFNQSKSIYEKLDNDPSGLAYNLGNIGLVQAEMGQLKKAEANLKASILQLDKLDDHYAVAIFLSYMADIYQKQGRLKAAQSFADSSMTIAKRYGFKAEAMGNSLRLANINALNSDYQSAYKFHQQYVSIKDSITNDEVYGRIENLENAFELSRKQAEVELLKERERNQQIIITTTIIIAIILIVLAIVSFGYYQSKSRVNKILEQQKASLESLNRTKDKYFSIISHDMRGPILAFHGVSRLIKMLAKRNETAELIELADDIDDSVHNLSSMLDGLLNWALQQQGQIPNHPEKINLKRLVNELVETFSTMASAKNILFIHKIDPSLHLMADLNTSRTILRNLANNAIKFTPENGEVLIEALENGDFVEIRIIDTGVGIPEDKLQKLFKFQHSSDYGTAGEKGLGLGLQLVYEFVEMNKGSISVDSHADKGTTFTLNLPKAVSTSKD